MRRPSKRPLELRGFPAELFARARFGPLPASIVWVEDGDSVRGMVDGGRRRYELDDLRLFGVNAPDAGKDGATAADEARWRSRLAELLGFDLEAADRGEDVVAHCLIHPSPGEDKYGRWLVSIELPDGRIANEVLGRELAVDKEARKAPIT